MNGPNSEPLILASTSPYRARLLARLHLPFNVVAPGTDETPIEGESGVDLARRLAAAKSRSCDVDDGIVIGSDQVAVCGDQILGKPGNAAQAKAQLTACQGSTVTFYTGLALWRPVQQQLIEHVEPFQVDMRPLSEPEIDRYIAIDEPYDCAGSFKWEALGISLFDAMHGEDPTALEGLPLISLCRMLRKLGFELPPRPQSTANSL